MTANAESDLHRENRLAETITDQGLLELAARGDEEAFRRLYERHRDAIFRFAYRMLSSSTLAEDVTQDCFIGLLKRPDGFRPEIGSLRSYLYAAARNLSLKHLQRTGCDVAIDDLSQEPSLAARHGPLATLLEAELASVVRAAIDVLPPLQREAVILFEYEELSLAEIAAIVDADAGAVKARLHRARQRLKVLLGPYIRKGGQDIARGNENEQPGKTRDLVN